MFTPPTIDQVPSAQEMVAIMDRTVAGLTRVKKRLAVALRRFLVSAALGRDIRPTNMLLIGGSGSGKTHIVRALLSSVPCIWADVSVTSYSDVGYIGRDLASMYLDLAGPDFRGSRRGDEKPIALREFVPLIERFGVVVLDEFDKLRAQQKPGERQVGLALQHELLTMVEGTEVLVRRNEEDRGGFSLNTRGILHIAVGAFPGLSAYVARDLGVEAEPHHYQEASLVNLCHYGFTEELIGRFSTVLTLPPLDVGAMARILREQIVPVFTAQFADEGVQLVVDDGAINAAASKCALLPIGARALAPLIDECLWAPAFDARPGDRLELTPEGISRGHANLVRGLAA